VCFDNTFLQEGSGGSAKEEVRKKPRKVAARSSRPSSAAAASGGANAAAASSSATNQHVYHQSEGLSAAQQAVQEQMRRALEEDQYSAVGSILDIESEEEDHTLYNYRGIAVRLDKAALQQAVRKNNLLERLSGSAIPASTAVAGLAGGDLDEEEEEDDDDDDEDDTGRKGGDASSSGGGRRVGGATNKTKKRKNRKDEVSQLLSDDAKNATASSAPVMKDPLSLDAMDDDLDRDGGSIFGATTGNLGSTWVECDKCKKVELARCFSALVSFSNRL
jgi:hypothetical protein